MSDAALLYLLSLTVRSWILAGAAGLITLRMRNAALRHAVWTLVLAGALLMPILDAALPPIFVIHSAPPATRIGELAQTLVWASGGTVVDETPRLSWQPIAATAYACVALTLLARLALAYSRIRRLKRHSPVLHTSVLRQAAAACGLKGALPDLRESNSARAPVTVFFLRPAILLPADWRNWDEWKLQAVLAHELAHVRRRDWIVAQAAALYASVFWCNPLSWALLRRLGALAEEASDAAALAIAGDAPRYAETLLDFAAAHRGRRLAPSGVAMAAHNLRSRITRVLEAQNLGSGFMSRTRWCCVLACAAPLLYASAAIEPVTGKAAAPAFVMKGNELFEAKPEPVSTQEVRIGGAPILPDSGMTPPSLRSYVLPEYTEEARLRRIEGVVTVQAAFDIDGTFRVLRVLKGLGYGLDEKALEALQRWRYAPAYRNGARVSVVAEIDVPFRLPAETGPVRLGPGIAPPVVVFRVQPRYPAEARVVRHQGFVVLEVVIPTDGSVSILRVVRSAGFGLDEAAIEAIRQWQFKPATKDGVPIDVVTNIEVNFNLR